MPDSGCKILDLLAVDQTKREFKDFEEALLVGTPLPMPEPVFPRFIEDGQTQ